MIHVASGGEQHESTTTDCLKQLGEGSLSRNSPQLGAISARELREELGVMAVPRAQLRARCEVLRPLVKVDLSLGDPSGPQPIDEYPVVPAMPTRIVIDANDLDLRVRHGPQFLVEPPD